MNVSASKIKGNCGFTLIEILIALLISGILMGAFYTAFSSQQRSYIAQDQVVEMQQNLRAVISYITQDLRMIGYDPYCSATAGIEEADATMIAFSYIADDDGLDNDEDGSIDESGELQLVTFDLYDDDSDGSKEEIGRQAGNSVSSKSVIAENIEELEFRYLDSDGDVTGDLDDIKAVQVSLLARAGKSDTSFNNTIGYTSASGASWGPYNDGYRRRFQTVTIYLRNMEL